MRYMRVLAVLLLLGGIAVGANLAAQTTARSAARLPSLQRGLQQFLAAPPFRTHPFFPGPRPARPPFFRPLMPQVLPPGGGTCFVAGCSIKPCVFPVANSTPGYLVAPAPGPAGSCQPGAGRFRISTVIAR